MLKFFFFCHHSFVRLDICRLRLKITHFELSTYAMHISSVSVTFISITYLSLLLYQTNTHTNKSGQWLDSINNQTFSVKYTRLLFKLEKHFCHHLCFFFSFTPISFAILSTRRNNLAIYFYGVKRGLFHIFFSLLFHRKVFHIRCIVLNAILKKQHCS